MRLKRKLTRFISLVLVAMVTFSSLDLTAFAAENDQSIILTDSYEDVQDEVELGEEPEETALPEGLAELEKQLQEIENGGLMPSEEELASEETADEEAVEEASEEAYEQFETSLSDDVLESNGFLYVLDDRDLVHIVGYNNTDVAELSVPILIDEKIVTAIETNAFTSLSELKKISISFYVRNISDNAFNSNVCISAYNGSYALKYATSHAMSYENPSKLDFVDAAKDLTEILPGHVSIGENHTVYMNEYEAADLKIGSVFYLPASENVAVEEAYKVLSRAKKDGQVVLTCDRAIGLEVVNSIVIHEENMTPLWDEAVYYFDSDGDGVDEEYTIEEMNQEGENSYSLKSLFGEFHVVIPKTKLSEVDLTKSFKNFSLGGSLKVEVDGDFDINFKEWKVNSYVFHANEVASLTLGYGYDFADKTIPFEKELTFATVPFATVGMATVSMDVSMVTKMDGSISITCSTTAYQTVFYDHGKLTYDQYVDSKTELSAEISASLGLRCSIAARVGVMKAAQIYAEIGVKGSISYNQTDNLNTGTGSRQMKITLKAYGRLGAEIKFFDFCKASASVDCFDKVIKEWIIMQYGSCMITYRPGKGLEIPSYITPMNQPIGSAPIVEPIDGYTIEGWYTDINWSKKWNFEKDLVTGDMILYAKWAKAYKVTLKAEGVPDSYMYSAAGNLLPEPKDPRKLDYRFDHWYKKSNYTEPWFFEQDRMPENNITLYGQFVYEEGYDPWKEDLLGGGSLQEIQSQIEKLGFQYAVSDIYPDYIIIKKYIGKDRDVTVPTNIGGITVREIAADAFRDNKDIEKLTISDTVTKIGVGALQGCTGLKEITLPSLSSNDYKTFGGLFVPTLSSGAVLPDTTTYENLKTVTLTKATEIPYDGFKNWKYIEEIHYPSTITNIGNRAFENCGGLTELDLGNQLKTIGESAFSDCYNLNGLVIPGSVTSIGGSAFRNCKSITSLYIPESVSSVSAGLFYGCTGLQKITVPRLVKDVDTFGAFFRDKSSNAQNLTEEQTAQYTAFKKVTVFALRNNTVASSAFVNWTGIEEIVLPDNTTAIANNAFLNCRSLKTINIPETVTSIGENAFKNCISLSEIKLPAGLTTIRVGTFAECAALNSIAIPDTVTTIGKEAFYNCVGLNEIVLSEKITSIGENAFAGCTELTIYGTNDSTGYNYATKNGITFVALGETLAKVTYEYNNGKEKQITYAEIGKTITEPTIPVNEGCIFAGWFIDEEQTETWNFDIDVLPGEGITLYAGWEADGVAFGDYILDVKDNSASILRYVGKQTNLAIPSLIGGKKITAIDELAFAGNTYVRTLVIPATVEKIAADAFLNMEHLYKISVDALNTSFVAEDNVLFTKNKDTLIFYPIERTADNNTYTVPETVTSIEANAFASCHLKEVILPTGLLSIGDMSFANCQELKKITLPESVQKLGVMTFWNCPELMAYGPVNDTYIVNYMSKHLIQYNMYPVVFRDGEKELYHNSAQAGKVISSAIVSIAEGYSEEGFNVEGWYKNASCEEETEWNFASDLMVCEELTLYVKKVCDFAYTVDAGKVTITGVNRAQGEMIIPETIEGYPVTSILTNAFTDSGIQSVDIPSCVESIEAGAFRSGITIIADTNTSAMTFAQNNGLVFQSKIYSLTYELNGGHMDDDAQVGYTRNALITKPTDPTKDNCVFNGWYTQDGEKFVFDSENGRMPAHNMTLYAIWNVMNPNSILNDLRYLEEEDTVTILGYSGTEKHIIIPANINGKNVTTIGENAFLNTNIVAVELPDTVVEIQTGAFRGCKCLEEIVFPTALAKLSADAFSGCESLREVDLSACTGLDSVLEAGVFRYCASLNQVNLPEHITTIGNSTFAGCLSLQNIQLPASLETIGENAFYGDRYLSSFVIPKNVTTMGSGFIDSCTRINKIEVDAENSVYSDSDGILYKGTSLIRCPEGKTGEITVKEGTIKVNVGSFYNCDNITKIILPNSVTSLGTDAFAYCASLSEVYVGKNVSNIKETAFLADDNLTVYGYPDSEMERFALAHPAIRFDYIRDAVSISDKPVLVSVDGTTVTLEQKEGYEYRYEGGEWQNSAVFADLNAVSDYTFYTRIKDKEHVSEASEGLTVHTGKGVGRTVKTPVIMEITGRSVTIAAVEGCEYSLDGTNWQSESCFDGLKGSTTYTCYQRMAETATNNAGSATTKEFTTLEQTESDEKPEDNVWGDLTEEQKKDFDNNPAKIPEGYWIGGVVDEIAYKGRAITFDKLGVYWQNKALEYNKDYTVKYANNIKVGTALITITGKGNFAGVVKKNFKIVPADMEEESYKTKVTKVAFVGNNKVQKGIPAVTCELDGKTIVLKNKTDFTVVYPKTDVAASDYDASAFKAPGSYTGKILFQGNYVGEIPFTEDILVPGAGVPVSKLKVKSIPAQACTNSDLKPKPEVYNGQELLKEGVHYELSYPEGTNAKVGVGYVTITGKGEFVGSRILSFKIVATSFSKVAKYIAGVNELGYAYTGKEIKPENVFVYSSAESDAVKFKEDIDYKVSYTGNIKKGTATMVFTGIGKYSGKVTKKFKIVPYDMGSGLNTRISAVYDKDVEQQNGGTKPTIVLKDLNTGATLKEKTDYTLSYSANQSITTSKDEASYPYVVVSGKGNYSGGFTLRFKIIAANLDHTSGTATDVVCADKVNICKPTITLKNALGAALKAGKDYSKTIEYFYAEPAEVLNRADGTAKTVLRNVDEAINKDDVVPIGAKVRAHITGMGIYEGTTKDVYFHFVKADLKKATIKVNDITFSWNAKEPTKDDITVTIKVDGKVVTLTKEDYEIVSYSNNINKGKATITIRGVGVYGGTKTSTFSIGAKLFALL